MELILTRHIMVTMDSQTHQFSDLNFVDQTATELGVGLCELAGVGLINYSDVALGVTVQFFQRKALVSEGDRD